ncbi:RecX family transcriptional regulator [uncultured Aquincola sp.]|uniref:regulatory protein RecX n=1 Tax=uncultured Aquincola sp. TaxID=886556 RepID=UPI0032B308F6
MAAAPARLSLKARALKLLAQREHSRLELRRKLLPHAQAFCQARDEALEAAPAGVPPAAEPLDTPNQCLDKLLDWLQAHRYLSEERFVESRLHARSARFGNSRIKMELAQHGLALDAEQAAQLRTTELERARALWQRRFGSPATDPAGRAKQMRFLAGRGFSGETIRRVVQGLDEDACG